MKRWMTGAHLPPGAPPDWIREIRTSDSGLQRFDPFDLAFSYPGDDGAKHERRRVTVARLSIDTFGGTLRPGALYVIGWCHARLAPRTFRVDRMVDVHEPETGEVYADPRAALLSRVRKPRHC